MVSSGIDIIRDFPADGAPTVSSSCSDITADPTLLLSFLARSFLLSCKLPFSNASLGEGLIYG